MDSLIRGDTPDVKGVILQADGRYQCRFCVYKTSAISEFREHFNCCHIKACLVKGICPYCQFKVKGVKLPRDQVNVTVRNHLHQTHDQQIPFPLNHPVYHKCSTCGLLFQSEEILLQHIQQLHSGINFSFEKSHFDETMKDIQCSKNDEETGCGSKNDSREIVVDNALQSDAVSNFGTSDESMNGTAYSGNFNNDIRGTGMARDLNAINSTATTASTGKIGKDLKCYICNFEYSSLEELRAHGFKDHMKEIDTNGLCFYCEYKYNGKPIKIRIRYCTRRHFKNAHDEVLPARVGTKLTCLPTIKSPKTSVKILNVHRCSKCFYKTSVKKLLTRHMKKMHTRYVHRVHKKEEYKIYPSYRRYYKPIKFLGKHTVVFNTRIVDFCVEQNESGLYKCILCDFSDSSLDSLRRHIYEKNNSTTVLPSWLSCNHCNYKVNWTGLSQDSSSFDVIVKGMYEHLYKQHFLELHRKCNTGNNSQSHQKCRNEKVGISDVTPQMYLFRVLGKSRRFSCNLCDFKSNIKSLVVKHAKRKHSKEFPDNITCPICFMKFKHQEIKNERTAHTNAFVIHLNLFHGDYSFNPGELQNRFKCSACPLRFPTKRELNLHFKSRHENQRLPCAVCKVTFRNNKALSNHVRLSSHHLLSSYVGCSDESETKNSYDSNKLMNGEQQSNEMPSKTRMTLDNKSTFKSDMITRRFTKISSSVNSCYSTATLYFASLLALESPMLQFNSLQGYLSFCKRLIKRPYCNICKSNVNKESDIDSRKISSFLVDHVLCNHNPENLKPNELLLPALIRNGQCKICGLDQISENHSSFHHEAMKYLDNDDLNRRNCKAIIEDFQQQNPGATAEFWAVFMKSFSYVTSLEKAKVFIFLYIPFNAKAIQQLYNGLTSYATQEETITIPFYIAKYSSLLEKKSRNLFKFSSRFHVFCVPLYMPIQSDEGLTEQGRRTLLAEQILLVLGLIHLKNGFDIFKNVKFQPVGRKQTLTRIRRNLQWLTREKVKNLFAKILDEETTIFCTTEVAGLDCLNPDCKALVHCSDSTLVFSRTEKMEPVCPLSSKQTIKELAFFRDSPATIRSKPVEFYVDDFISFLEWIKQTLSDNVYVVAVSKVNSNVPVPSLDDLHLTRGTCCKNFYVYTGCPTFDGVSPCSFPAEGQPTTLTQSFGQGFWYRFEVLNETYNHEVAEVIEGLVQLGGVIYDNLPTETLRNIKVINQRLDYVQIALASYETLLQFFEVCFSQTGFIFEEPPENPNEGLIAIIGKRLVIGQSPKYPLNYPFLPRFDIQGNIHLEEIEDEDVSEDDEEDEV